MHLRPFPEDSYWTLGADQDFVGSLFTDQNQVIMLCTGFLNPETMEHFVIEPLKNK